MFFKPLGHLLARWPVGALGPLLAGPGRWPKTDFRRVCGDSVLCLSVYSYSQGMFCVSSVFVFLVFSFRVFIIKISIFL